MVGIAAFFARFNRAVTAIGKCSFTTTTVFIQAMVCGLSQVVTVKSVLRIQVSKGFGLWRKVAHGAAILAIVASTVPPGTIPAHALFDGSKSLTILHMHTGETATITFKRNGSYDQQALQKLNWLLRDWRTDEPTKMDPRLFDLLAEVYEESGSSQPIRVVSAYRSPKTNSMLRRRSKMVAEHSQHMLGKAMDFYLTDVSPAKVRAIGIKLQEGGVGYYPTANTPFTHLDVGGVRAWPRMTLGQLAGLFPDGKTVHIPADGRPLAQYEEAKAMILARGGKVSGEQYAVADASSGGNGKSFWSRLFGGRDEEEDQEPVAPRNAVAARNKPSQQVAANDDNDRAVASYAPPQARNSGGNPPVAPVPEPAPVRIAATPPRSETPPTPAPDIPLPPTRQVATLTETRTGPQMVWQTGAPGQPSPDNPFRASNNNGKVPFTTAEPPPGSGMGNVMAYAPLPPSRPGAAPAVARVNPNLVKEPISTASLPRVPVSSSQRGQEPVKFVFVAGPATAVPAKPIPAQKTATSVKAKPNAKAPTAQNAVKRPTSAELKTAQATKTPAKARGKK